MFFELPSPDQPPRTDIRNYHIRIEIIPLRATRLHNSHHNSPQLETETLVDGTITILESTVHDPGNKVEVELAPRRLARLDCTPTSGAQATM